jgi:hypothetical protein
LLATCLAAKLLTALGLGQFVRTIKITGGGRPNWWFVARPVEASMHAVLSKLGIDAASTPSVAAYTAAIVASVEKPIRSPDVNWGLFLVFREQQDLFFQ